MENLYHQEYNINNKQYSCSSSSSCHVGFPSISVPMEAFEQDKATTASKSHSQAEKRRRDRINAHLSTLRKLIPMSDKMDKAALLGSVIDRVKDLKRKAVEVGKTLIVPTEVDEIMIETTSDDDDDDMVIRVSLCCDDRPELFSELRQVLNSLRLTTVRADVATIGGRIKSVLVLSSKDKSVICINSLRQSLKLVLNRIASQSMASQCRARSKRQRFFLPSHHQ